MTDIDKIIPFIESSLKHMTDNYQGCSKERKLLHSIEWTSSPDSGSVLGEAEVRADIFAGIATKLLKHNSTNLNEETLKLAKTYSVLSSPTIVTWLTEASSNFPLFVNYIQSIEFLRLTIIEVPAQKLKG